MPMQHGCTIVSISRPNPYAFDMTLEAGEMARAARPGQFVHIRCGEGLLLRRPISICDAQGDLLRVVFEVRGEGTRWLSQRKTGETLDVLGPLGNGFSPAGKDILLVGGGIGVPPMLGCARAYEAQGALVHAVLGFRDREHLLLAEEMKAYCEAVVVTTDDGSFGIHGYVDGQVRALLEQGTPVSDILACGPKPMLRSVYRAATEFGVPCQVSMEERMGCGVGACLVCACEMQDGVKKHVCKDGPVFRAEEVKWDA